MCVAGDGSPTYVLGGGAIPEQECEWGVRDAVGLRVGWQLGLGSQLGRGLEEDDVVRVGGIPPVSVYS